MRGNYEHFTIRANRGSSFGGRVWAHFWGHLFTISLRLVPIFGTVAGPSFGSVISKLLNNIGSNQAEPELTPHGMLSKQGHSLLTVGEVY